MAALKIDGFFRLIAFKSGLILTPAKGDIIVVIGPNNSGKSATLRDLKTLLEGNGLSVVLDKVELERLTHIDEIEKALLPLREPNGSIQVYGHSFHADSPRVWWTNPGHPLGSFMTSLLVTDLTTRTRLDDCDPAPSFDARRPHSANHPFQHFYQDDRLEAQASALFRRAFKMDLVVHRAASSSVPAYVGEAPSIEAGEDRLSRTYLDRLEALERLEVQGDGMRSFVSIMGRVLSESSPILLIDEPEAFLHPPQARLLADVIAGEAKDRQMVLATHSSDVLQGLLSSHAIRVSVIRLSRTGKGGDAVHLKSEEVAELWKDPILRFSNVLDGLFHEGVVITEADADCRFYEAVTSASVDPASVPDVHYTYSGGKDRLPVVISSLKRLGVPVVTIADFDLLNSENPLSLVVAAHGGNWATIKPDWLAFKGAVEQGGGFVDARQFRAEMSALLKVIPDSGAVDRHQLSIAKKLAKNASPWGSVKQSGLAGIGSGEPTLAANRLLSALNILGIFVTPNGEMEGFCRSQGGHGPRWVAEVLKKDLAKDVELSSVRAFVAEIIDHLNEKLGRK